MREKRQDPNKKMTLEMIGSLLLDLSTKVLKLENVVQKLDSTVQKLDQKVQQLDQKVQQLDRKVQQLDQKVQQLDRKVQQLDQKVQKIDQKIDDLAASTAREFILVRAEMKDRFDHLLRMIRSDKGVDLSFYVADKRKK